MSIRLFTEENSKPRMKHASCFWGSLIYRNSNYKRYRLFSKTYQIFLKFLRSMADYQASIYFKLYGILTNSNHWLCTHTHNDNVRLQNKRENDTGLLHTLSMSIIGSSLRRPFSLPSKL